MDENKWWNDAIRIDSMQVSAKMRRGEGNHFWWCLGCEEMHPLPDRWTFNGDVNKSTFSPSFLHNQGSMNPNHKVCHYIITDGRVAYCGDSQHALANQTIDMPDLPPEMQDL